MRDDRITDLVKKAGGPVALAKELGVTHSAVSQWTVVPAKHAQKVSEITGVSLHDLRPDIFPAPAQPIGAV